MDMICIILLILSFVFLSIMGLYYFGYYRGYTKCEKKYNEILKKHNETSEIIEINTIYDIDMENSLDW